MSISLVTRSGNGAPVTAVQNDANMAAIQAAVNQNITTLGNKVDTASIQGWFYPLNIATGHLRVGWADLLNTPKMFQNPSVFRAVKTDAVQTIAASGSLTAHFGTKDFDIGVVYDTGTYRFTASNAGVYRLETSVQVSLASGSPTNVSIIVNLRINGANREQATLDNTGTGTRIYKVGTLANLAAGDYADVTVDFTFSGTATWQIDATNTTFSGFPLNYNTLTNT